LKGRDYSPTTGHFYFGILGHYHFGGTGKKTTIYVMSGWIAVLRFFRNMG
jgi:hypothetical protein